MDLNTIKDKLDDGTFSELSKYVEGLISQRDAARNESIDGRKAIKEKVVKLESWQEAALEKLGIGTPDELNDLPEVKGQAEAAKQFEAKIKRLERELSTIQTDRDTWKGKHQESARAAAISSALTGHEFVDREIVEAFISARVTDEDGEFLFKGDDGKLLPVKDGVASLVASKPALLKAPGNAGAGVPSRGSAGAKTMPESQFNALPAKKQAEWMESVNYDQNSIIPG